MTHQEYAGLARQTLEQISADCALEVFHASGPGGQGVNTADSAVRLRHVPTGIVVTSRESRSQHRNRQICLRKLREEFRRRSLVPRPRVKTKVTRAAHQRRLEEKSRHSRLKALRRRPLDE